MNIKDLIFQIGINFQVSYEKLENIKGIIPLKGELFFLEDKKILVIGTGSDPVEKLRGINFKTISYNSDDLISVLVAKMWLELELSANIGERIEKFLPKNLLEEFIKQKPDNFTFFLGEEVPLKSPLRPFVKVMPNYAGAFFRNYNHGSEVDPNGNRDFTKIQDSSIQEHKHKTASFWDLTIRNSYLYNSNQSQIRSLFKSNSENETNYLKYEEFSNFIKIDGIEDPFFYVEGKETRPINFTSLSLMKTL